MADTKPEHSLLQGTSIQITVPAGFLELIPSLRLHLTLSTPISYTGKFSVIFNILGSSFGMSPQFLFIICFGLVPSRDPLAQNWVVLVHVVSLRYTSSLREYTETTLNLSR